MLLIENRVYNTLFSICIGNPGSDESDQSLIKFQNSVYERVSQFNWTNGRVFSCIFADEFVFFILSFTLIENRQKRIVFLVNERNNQDNHTTKSGFIFTIDLLEK